VQKESGIDGQQSRQLDEFALHWASGTGHLALGIWHWASVSCSQLQRRCQCCQAPGQGVGYL